MTKAHETGVNLQSQTADHQYEVTQQVLNQFTKP